jgi:hypothetical protein
MYVVEVKIIRYKKIWFFPRPLRAAIIQDWDTALKVGAEYLRPDWEVNLRYFPPGYFFVTGPNHLN